MLIKNGVFHSNGATINIGQESQCPPKFKKKKIKKKNKFYYGIGATIRTRRESPWLSQSVEVCYQRDLPCLVL